MEEFQNAVNRAVRGEQGHDDVGRDNPGYEIGKIGGGLHRLFELHALDLINRDGDQDRHREGEEQRDQRGGQRISHDDPEVAVVEEVTEPFQADELARKQGRPEAAERRLVIDEGHV